MLLSIITINYNNLNGLKQTLQSLKEQIRVDNMQYEYIVIDGLSDDGSVEYINQNNIITKYKVEKDTGIADAFNKGINFSTGKYIYFLNSGDIFNQKDSLSLILQYLKNTDCDIYINKVNMVDENGNILNQGSTYTDLSKQKYRNYLSHQGMLIKKNLFDKYGLYDQEYRLGMDYEWSLRLLQDTNSLKICISNDIICKMLQGGISQTQYIGTFMAYHKARIKNNISSKYFSLLLSLFFITKRTIGIQTRKLLKFKR